jgi:hypothetical protein
MASRDDDGMGWARKKRRSQLPCPHSRHSTVVHHRQPAGAIKRKGCGDPHIYLGRESSHRRPSHRYSLLRDSEVREKRGAARGLGEEHRHCIGGPRSFHFPLTGQVGRFWHRCRPKGEGRTKAILALSLAVAKRKAKATGRIERKVDATKLLQLRHLAREILSRRYNQEHTYVAPPPELTGPVPGQPTATAPPTCVSLSIASHASHAKGKKKKGNNCPPACRWSGSYRRRLGVR